MGGLDKRLGRLEDEARTKRGPYGRGMSERAWERHFHAHENARREILGLESLPEIPYTEEDRKDDERTLAETIPAYRSNSGWQTETARTFLNDWERHIRERLKRGVPQ